MDTHMDPHITIAIDGPAGSGKSTAARAVARALDILYLDTGAMYRAVALYALRRGVDPADCAGVTALLPQIRLDMSLDEEGSTRVLLCGEDVSRAIRTPEVSAGASDVGAHPAVRARMVALQRAIAAGKSVAMDGRDIGTHVLPDATHKFYVTAAVQERARRRHLELLQRGEAADLQQVQREMVRRDHNDSHREVAPLRPAPDAIQVDTTAFTSPEQTVQCILDHIRQKQG